jgi:hypothetical protein
MVDKLLHGPARSHHKFTVASMVNRRAGRTFSDLACGTGMHRTRHGAWIHRGNRSGLCVLAACVVPVTTMKLGRFVPLTVLGNT